MSPSTGIPHCWLQHRPYIGRPGEINGRLRLSASGCQRAVPSQSKFEQLLGKLRVAHVLPGSLSWNWSPVGRVVGLAALDSEGGREAHHGDVLWAFGKRTGAGSAASPPRGLQEDQALGRVVLGPRRVRPRDPLDDQPHVVVGLRGLRLGASGRSAPLCLGSE